MSLWEIAIKIKIGKLNIKNSIRDIAFQCKRENINILPLKVEHMDKTIDLPLDKNHKDPFDRLILSMAFAEKMILISTDLKMKKYDIDVIS